MDILVLSRVDSESPIATIHREVGRRSKHTVHAFARNPERYDLSGICVHELRFNLVGTARSYLSQFTSGIDVVHTGPYLKSVLYLLRQPFPSSWAVVHTYHSIPENTTTQPLTFRMRRKVLAELAAATTANSEYVAEGIAHHYSSIPTVVPNGVDRDMFRPERRTTVPGRHLYVGRNEPQKNPKLVLEIADKAPHSEFRMCLTGQEDSEMASAIEKRANVTLLPYLSTSEMANEMAEATSLLAPFRNEGFGMVVVEAMASGTPVVGLHDGNLPNIIQNGKTGYIHHYTDVTTWAKSVGVIEAGDIDESTVRDYTERFSWKRVAQQYDDVYEAVGGGAE